MGEEDPRPPMGDGQEPYQELVGGCHSSISVEEASTFQGTAFAGCDLDSNDGSAKPCHTQRLVEGFGRKESIAVYVSCTAVVS